MPYELSTSAEKDLEDIYDYTVAMFGLNQADSYLLEFKNSFELLSKNPQIGRARNEIKRGLYSITKDNHIIFYRIIKYRLRVVRIMHGSRDLPQHF